MTNIIDITYSQTGESKSTNALGMREMQRRAYESKNYQYILLKAPPASGKSRALMFIALDKLYNQNLKKVIVAVPERSIGGSFGNTNLKSHGFFMDWSPNPKYNLCTPGGDQSKVQSFLEFLESDERILICTHTTLRFAFEAINTEQLNNCLLAIDEFHHVSASNENQLGELVRSVMQNSTAHIVAMTGSYFRGDSVPVLTPEYEQKFSKVTYTYYEQLNGYDYLKSLGIGYHFYQGKYTSAINEILDTNRKTILHIPNVNSGESTKEKHNEVDLIIDSIGSVEKQDEQTGVLYVKRKGDGKVIKVADLVDDRPLERDKIVNYLKNVKSPEDIDLIIALGMAKEGFDWPFCEHALTICYRGSLTEIVQIIGRCTRDSNNKNHAQFTNLIAQPDASDDMVKVSVNNMLKAITCSLLMEQVLAPNFKFKTKLSDEEFEDGTIAIRGFKEPSSLRSKEIIESDMNDLKAIILQDATIQKCMMQNVDPEVINKVFIPKVIKQTYPDLNQLEIEEVRQHIVADSFMKNNEVTVDGDRKFIHMAGKFINIDDLHIDLIDQVNPFQKAYEILSKSLTTQTFKLIRETIEATRIEMTDEEAILLYPKIQDFFKQKGYEPKLNSSDPLEKRMADALVYLKHQRRKHGI